MATLLGWLFFGFIFGIICTVIADNKGRNVIGWFFWGIILGPIGIIIIAILPKIGKKLEEQKIQTGEYKKCPQCAETVKKEAKICRYCGNEIPLLG